MIIVGLVFNVASQMCSCGRASEIPGLDPSTWTARPEYALPVPSDATAPGPCSSHREVQRFYCLLYCVVLFTGRAR